MKKMMKKKDMRMEKSGMDKMDMDEMMKMKVGLGKKIMGVKKRK